MNTKLFLPIILGMFLLTFASASILDITISQNETFANFDLSTSGYDWDEQELELSILESFGIDIPEEVENVVIGMTLSEFIDEINFRIEFNDGETYPEFTSFELNEFCNIYFSVEGINLGEVELIIEEDITLNELITTINMMGPSFIEGFEDIPSCSEININLLNNLLQENIPQFSQMVGNPYFEKDGINYELGYDFGYGDVPEEYDERVTEIIEEAFYLISVTNEIIPFDIGYDFDFDVSVDLSNIEYVAEIPYDVIVTIAGVEQIITVTFDEYIGTRLPYEEEEEEIPEDDTDDGSPSSSDDEDEDEDEEDETILGCVNDELTCIGGSLYTCEEGSLVLSDACEYGCENEQCNDAPIIVQDDEEDEDKSFIAGITGAVVDTLGTGGTIAISTLILGLIGAFSFVKIRKIRAK